MADPTTNVPPVALPPAWETIPASLAQRQQWVLWKYEWDAKREKWLKVPYYVAGGRRTGDQGSDRDRQRLATLPVARAAYERRHGAADAWCGIGFAFLPGDGLIGIDLDRHADKDAGTLSERAAKIVAAFNTYTEYSTSGTGIHLYLEGHTHTAKSNDIGVEMFCEKQYFIVTGHHVAGTPLEVAVADESAIRRMHATIQEAKDKHAPPPASAPAQHKAGARNGRDDFRYVNDEAMRALHAWVPALFGGRETSSHTKFGPSYRVTSKALGRDLEEDISITPGGIKDCGVADMGDAREGARTPIDLVMEWGPDVRKPREALHWLARVLGIVIEQPSATNATKPPAAKNPAPAGGGNGASAPPPGGGAQDGAEDEDDDGGGLVALEEALQLHKGRPMDCRENVMYCLQFDPAVRKLVRLNDFTKLLERSRPTPWGNDAGEWSEEDDLMLGEYLLRTHRVGIKAKGTLRDGVLMAARANRYNPIVDWIKAEKWDGTPRLEHWLTMVYDIEERPYTRLIGKCFMMGLVKRALEPGCKFDYMLIIKGEQGLQKSGAWRALAYPYFTDNAIRVGDKDSQMAQQLAWIVESAELESLNKSESTAIKQHLSAQEDWYRPPYGAQMI
ncbi:MAG: hypothetical protein F9K35_17160, partial [Burkholderiaceae bacterium]